MKFDTKGSGSLVLIFIILVLGFIAYGIFKNKSIAPGEEMILEESTQEQEQTSSSNGNTSSQTTAQVSSQTQTTTTVETETELQTMEEETEALDTEINDLMFEDLGFE